MSKLLIILTDADSLDVEELTDAIPGGSTWVTCDDVSGEMPWAAMSQQVLEPAWKTLVNHRQRAMDARKAAK